MRRLFVLYLRIRKATDEPCICPISADWKGNSCDDLTMDFVTGLLISADLRGGGHNSILVIVNRLTKMFCFHKNAFTVDSTLSGLINKAAGRCGNLSFSLRDDPTRIETEAED